MRLKKLFSKSTTSSKDVVPALTAAAVAEAKQRPNGYVYAIDGIADPNGAVPPERIKGAWKVDADGKIAGGRSLTRPPQPLSRTVHAQSA